MRDGFLSRRVSVLLVSLLIVAGFAALASAQADSSRTYVYEPAPGVFPHSSGQLWQLRGGSADAIASVVSVQDSVLRVDTTNGAPSIYWRILGDNPGWDGVQFPITLELRLKINKIEGRRAFSFEVTDANQYHAIVNFTDESVQLGSDPDVYKIDTTEWHTYRFEFTPGKATLYVDEDPHPAKIWDIGRNEGRASQINFGDTSSGWSGAYDLGYLKYTVYLP